MDIWATIQNIPADFYSITTLQLLASFPEAKILVATNPLIFTVYRTPGFIGTLPNDKDVTFVFTLVLSPCS